MSIVAAMTVTVARVTGDNGAFSHRINPPRTTEA
jgi:hypothetical protein